MTMKNVIEIHDTDTANMGYYSVWYKKDGELHKRLCSETLVNSWLNMRQKEDFFMGKYKFKILDYDFMELAESEPCNKLKHKHES